MRTIVLVACLICAAAIANVLAMEPTECNTPCNCTNQDCSNCSSSQKCRWIYGLSIEKIFGGDYNSTNGQGQVIIISTAQPSGYKYVLSIPLNVEWGQILYSMALTAQLKGKAINCLISNQITDATNKLYNYNVYRISISN